MKRTIFLLFVALFATTTLATVNWTSFGRGSEDHTAHKRAGGQQTHLAPRVSGATDPSAIPDTAAYEILFRLLSSTSPEEKKELRKSAYLKGGGFGPAESVAISNAAYEYKRQIEALDAEVDDIKNRHWPRPSQEIMGQLRQLQGQKEALIGRIATSLHSQVENYNPSKLSSHMAEVKRRTKGFSSSLPAERIGRLGQVLSDFFTVSAQSCDALTYIYNNVTVDYDQMAVYGSGSWSMPYNNCAHTITLSTVMNGPLGSYASGGDGTYINLEYQGNNLDGYFTSTTEASSWCNVVQQSSQAGNATDDKNVEIWVKLQSFTSVNPDHITGGGGDTTVTVSYSASLNAAGKNFGMSPGVQIASGTLQVGDLQSSSGGSISVGAGNFTMVYSCNTIARAGSFYPAVSVTNGTAKVLNPTFLQGGTAITVNVQ